VTGDLVGTDTVTAQGPQPWTGHARSGDFYPATSGDLDLAPSGDLFMATDTQAGRRSGGYGRGTTRGFHGRDGVDEGVRLGD
jgi:hypothetical protein